MTASTVIDLPDFDTGRYQSHELVLSGGNATLTIHVSELAPIVLRFTRVRWHQFTAVTNCTETMIDGSYFCLAEIKNSALLSSFVASDSANTKAYTSLHHFRIFLDESGCHEFFAQSATAL